MEDFELGSAPAVSSSCAISIWPSAAAHMRAVMRELLRVEAYDGDVCEMVCKRSGRFPVNAACTNVSPGGVGAQHRGVFRELRLRNVAKIGDIGRKADIVK